MSSDDTLTVIASTGMREERTLREERMKALSHLAGGLAHEIGNPLAIIHGLASDLHRSAMEEATLSREELAAASRMMVQTAERAIRILKGLRGLAREGGDDPMEYVSAYGVVEQALHLQEGRFERHGITLTAELEEGIPMLLCREVQIGQVLTNLLNNAFDAVAPKEAGARSVWVRMRAKSGKLEIDVIDSGFGIDEETRDRLMEPFFTTKTLGLGLGMGLSLSQAIADGHGGELELVHDRPETCFRLTLPLGPMVDEAND